MVNTTMSRPGSSESDVVGGAIYMVSTIAVPSFTSLITYPPKILQHYFEPRENKQALAQNAKAGNLNGIVCFHAQMSSYHVRQNRFRFHGSVWLYTSHRTCCYAGLTLSDMYVLLCSWLLLFAVVTQCSTLQAAALSVLCNHGMLS